MNNKLLIGLVAVVIIIVVGSVALEGSKNQTQTSITTQTAKQQSTTVPQAQSQQQQEVATIEVTSSGFSPAALTVKAGTRVTWNNQSGKEVSVNSDEHPTHRLNSQFNPGPVRNGSSISFTFEKPGTNPYHDHYNPSQTGTVIVQ